MKRETYAMSDDKSHVVWFHEEFAEWVLVTWIQCLRGWTVRTRRIADSPEFSAPMLLATEQFPA